MTVAYSAGALIAYGCAVAWYEGAEWLSWFFVAVLFVGMVVLLVKEDA